MDRNCLTQNFVIHLLHNIVIRTEYPRKQEYTQSLWTRGADHDLRLFITTYHDDYSGSCQRVMCIYILSNCQYIARKHDFNQTISKVVLSYWEKCCTRKRTGKKKFRA